MPDLGIHEKIVRVAPTESVHLEARRMYEDFNFGREELSKMQAILYALASKFLVESELEDVKEVVAITLLGEMLVQDGVKKGMEKGMERGIETGKAQSIIELLDELGEVPEELRRRFWGSMIWKCSRPG